MLSIPKGSRLHRDYKESHDGVSGIHGGGSISSSRTNKYQLWVDENVKKYIRLLARKVFEKFEIDMGDYKLEQSRQDEPLTSVEYFKKKDNFSKYYKALKDNSEYIYIVHTLELAANNAKRGIAMSTSEGGASSYSKVLEVIPEGLRPYFKYEKDYDSNNPRFPSNYYTYEPGTIIGFTAKVESMLNKIATKLSRDEQKDETEQKDQEDTNLNQSSAQDEENENQEENTEENNQVENTNQSNVHNSTEQSHNSTEEDDDDEDDGKQEEKDDTDNEDEDDQKDEIEEKESGENQSSQQNSTSQSNAMPQTAEELMAMFQKLKADFERAKQKNAQQKQALQQKDQIIDSQANTITTEKSKNATLTRDNTELKRDKTELNNTVKSKNDLLKSKDELIDELKDGKNTYKEMYNEKKDKVKELKEKLEQKTEEYDNLKARVDDDNRSISSFNLVNLNQQQEEKDDVQEMGVVNDDNAVES